MLGLEVFVRAFTLSEMSLQINLSVTTRAVQAWGRLRQTGETASWTSSPRVSRLTQSFGTKQMKISKLKGQPKERNK